METRMESATGRNRGGAVQNAAMRAALGEAAPDAGSTSQAVHSPTGLEKLHVPPHAGPTRGGAVGATPAGPSSSPETTTRSTDGKIGEVDAARVPPYVPPPPPLPPDAFGFPRGFKGWLPSDLGPKITSTIMSATGAGVGFVGITGGIWKIGQVFGARPELGAQIIGPLVGLGGAFVGSAVGFSFGAWVLRNAIDNQIRGKLDLRKQSFDNPDEMYEHLKDVRTVIFRSMGFPRRFEEKLDRIVEGREWVGEKAAEVQDAIRRLPSIPKDLAERIVEDVYKVGHFNENLQPPPVGVMDPELGRRWNAYLAANPAARAELGEILGTDAKLREQLNVEKEQKIGLIREVLQQMDFWKRPPLGMKRAISDIKELPVSDAMKSMLLDVYVPMSFEEKIDRAKKGSREFQRVYQAEVEENPDVKNRLQAILAHDQKMKDRGDVGRFGAVVEALFGRLGAEFKIRRTLGLGHKERRADEDKYESLKWYLLRRPRPYTSAPLSPRLWGREEFDLGKRAEIFVTALNNVFRQKVVFKGVGELTQTQIKGLINQELEGLKLQAEERQLSIHGHKFIAKGFQDQLAERYNYLFMKFDNLMQSCFSKDNITRTGAAMVVAPIVVGLALKVSGVGTWSFWQAVNPVVRPVMDFVTNLF